MASNTHRPGEVVGSFVNELYRRNVVRAVIAYLAFAFFAVQSSHLIGHFIGVTGTTERLILIFLTIGLIPTVFFSWRYEWMPEGLQEEENIVQPKSMHHPIAGFLDRVAFLCLLLAFLFLLVDRFVLEPQVVWRVHDSTPIGSAASAYPREAAKPNHA